MVTHSLTYLDVCDQVLLLAPRRQDRVLWATDSGWSGHDSSTDSTAADDAGQSPLPGGRV